MFEYVSWNLHLKESGGSLQSKTETSCVFYRLIWVFLNLNIIRFIISSPYFYSWYWQAQRRFWKTVLTFMCENVSKFGLLFLCNSAYIERTKKKKKIDKSSVVWTVLHSACCLVLRALKHWYGKLLKMVDLWRHLLLSRNNAPLMWEEQTALFHSWSLLC